MLIDLAINPFEAEVPSMIELAQAAEDLGYAGVWVADHFSGAVVGRRWSRDPFVCLAAIATATSRLDLGILVANARNRHPAQLTVAVNSLQSIAPGRVRLGIGSGANPGSRFAVEHEAIGTELGTADERRALLRDSIASVRAIWAGESSFGGAAGTGFRGLAGVVDGSARPPIIVGASAWPTVELALAHADGVNVRRTDRTDGILARIGKFRPPEFEVSLLDAFDDVVRAPHRINRAAEQGVDRLILGVSRPLDTDRIGVLDVERPTNLAG